MHKKSLINVNKLPFMTARPHAPRCGGCERCVNPHQLQPNRFNALAVIFTASQVRAVPLTANAMAPQPTPSDRGRTKPSSQQLHRRHLLHHTEITGFGERASVSAIITLYCHISSGQAIGSTFCTKCIKGQQIHFK
jgi:hypothetical protein